MKRHQIMRKKMVFFKIFVSICIVILALSFVIDGASTGNNIDWLKKKEEFYKRTTFPLSDANKRLFGGKYSQFNTGHLPFWFDFELYKTAFNKQYTNPEENLLRHHIYIKRCVRVLKARVLFRILAGTEDSVIDASSDQFYEEKMASIGSRAETAGSDRIAFSVSFLPDDTFTREGEAPLDKAIRLVREELDRVESRNQVQNYLMAFEEVDGSAIAAKLPYEA